MGSQKLIAISDFLTKIEEKNPGVQKILGVAKKISGDTQKKIWGYPKRKSGLCSKKSENLQIFENDRI